MRLIHSLLLTGLTTTLLTAAACDVDTQPEPDDGLDVEPTAIEDRGGELPDIEPVNFSYSVLRDGPQLHVDVPQLQWCIDGTSYETRIQDTYRYCDEALGEDVEVVFTCIKHFACVEGAWEHQWSACEANDPEPQWIPTGQPCGQSA